MLGPQYNQDFLNAAHHANALLTVDYKERHVDNTNPPVKYPRGLVTRPNHGLAHTLRTTRHSKVLLSFYKKHNSRLRLPYSFANFSETDLLKTQIAQLFYITGRESERSYGEHYYRYQRASGENFKKYAQTNLTHLYTPQEIEKFRKIIAQEAKDIHCPEKDLMYGAHGLDLMRCKDVASYSMPKYLTQLFGNEDSNSIIKYVHELMFATGEASLALWGVYPDNHKLYACPEDGAEKKFEACSLFPEEGLALIDAVEAPLAQLAQPTDEDDLIAKLQKLSLELEEEEKGVVNLMQNEGFGNQLLPLLTDVRARKQANEAQIAQNRAAHNPSTATTEADRKNMLGIEF
ncbi:MAG: SidE phosphodiesterase domain-containing protein [Candidatus Berkiella sp.]